MNSKFFLVLSIYVNISFRIKKKRIRTARDTEGSGILIYLEKIFRSISQELRLTKLHYTKRIQIVVINCNLDIISLSLSLNNPIYFGVRASRARYPHQVGRMVITTKDRRDCFFLP